MKQLIIEGRYDTLVSAMSNVLLSVIKKSYSAVDAPDGKFGKQKTYFRKGETIPNIADTQKYEHCYFRDVNVEKIPLQFYIMLKVQWQEGLAERVAKGFISDGGVYNEGPDSELDVPFVEVLFEIDPAMYPNVLSTIAMDLRDILRHEIEHLTQSGWNVMLSKQQRGDYARRDKIASGELERYKYYILPKEIPAMIQGLYMKAKKMRQPFKDVVNANLQQGVDTGQISAADKEKIINMWRKYLPKLGIRQEL